MTIIDFLRKDVRMAAFSREIRTFNLPTKNSIVLITAPEAHIQISTAMV